MAQDTREFDRYRLARILAELAGCLDRAATQVSNLSDEEREHLGATRCALIRVGDLIRAGVVPRDWLIEILACTRRQGRGMLDPQVLAETEALLDILAPPPKEHYAS